MMKISNLILVLAVGLCFGACKKAPTDEQLKDVLSKAHQTLLNRDSTPEQKEASVKRQLAEAGQTFDIMKANARQLGMLSQWNTFLRSKPVKEWVAPRLDQLSQKKDKEGAVAAYYRLVYDPAREKGGYTPEEVAVLLAHPSVGEVFRDSVLGTTLFSRLMWNVAGDQKAKAELYKSILPFIDDQLNDQQIKATVSLFDSALALDSLMQDNDREALRVSILKQQERLLANATKAGNEADINRANSNIAYLKSPIALNKLIGGEAPDIEFIWASSGKTGHLSDLKGKVVVLDFWATWCGPCVMSFPNIRELQKRYKKYPVEIIGVTSVQGRHIRRHPGEKPEAVDTKGNPEKEFELMKEFMKDADMTWKVAFSSGNVFNPMYGVKGIPHVAIIDAEGRVRYNALRPYNPPFHEAEKIDALLQEAGLKYPKEPMTQENFVKFN